MSWNAATPNIDGFTWARRLFQTDNHLAVCAGFSQTWLTFSLIGGEPVTKPGVLESPGHIQAIHQGRTRVRGQQRFIHLGSSSVETLRESGLRIEPGYPKHPLSTNWQGIFDVLASEPVGHYYLTIKAPFVHAMACIITRSEVYFLEPQKGLYVFPKTKFSEGMTAFYSNYTWSPLNDYKIYQVSQADCL
jgi:hypothetical protein